MNHLKKISLILLFVPLLLHSREYVVEGEINWGSNIKSKIGDYSEKNFFSFSSAKYDQKKDFLPFFTKQLDLNSELITRIEVVDFQFEDVLVENISGVSGEKYIENEVTVLFDNYTTRKKSVGEIRFYPIVKEGGRYKRIIKYKLKVVTQPNSFKKTNNNKSFTPNSVLQSGEWYKIAVLKEGIFKIDYNFLKNLGFDIDNLNPNDFQLYGNGGKMLPELNADYREDDLQQNAVAVIGAADNKFDPNDYVLFYGQSPHTWIYNQSTSLFEHDNHKYSDTTFYFITFSNTGQPPKRIGIQTSSSSPNQTVTSFNDYDFHDRDAINLIKSGDMWYSDVFDVKTSYSYSFNFPDIDLSTPVNVNFSIAGRSGSANVFSAIMGSNSTTVPLSAVNMSSYTSKYAWPGTGSFSGLPSSSLVNVVISFNKPTQESVGWLNEIEMNVRRNLTVSGNQLFFRDMQSVGAGNISNFNLGNALNVSEVWEITDPFNVKKQSFNLTGSNLDFSVETDSLRSFVAFNTQYESQVIGLGKVDNQNLHGIQAADMIIVSHPQFLSQAAQLSIFHSNEGLNVITVTPQQIYNEFSSGSQDIVAIRDFIRMLYERAPTSSQIPKYLLLFGDGSYDNKNRLTGNTNFIPTYQTPNSVDVIGSLVSDDYYGLLDVNEGEWVGPETVDIGIGRLPVKNQEEANNVVSKILNYNTSSTMKEWRNAICFVGDDEDNNAHMSQSNSLSIMVETNNKSFNPNKIFFDAYKQESTPGGSRYPDVNKEINETVQEGALIINYTGHGGEAGWAHERVLLVPDIESWNNSDLPLFVTATCEFSRFDDPGRTSAGEQVLLKPYGGIGLLTTVRLVFSGPNFILNQHFFNEVFKKTNGEYPAIGEIFMNVKNLNAGDLNNRNFTLLGDPALKLAYPIHDVFTTKINGNIVSSSDTLKALEKVTIDGEVRDQNGVKLTGFNGVIYPSVFDKFKQITALANDGGAPFSFNIQTNKLFKGKVSVTNGDFSYTFVIPKDISYNYGTGKLSYYDGMSRFFPANP